MADLEHTREELKRHYLEGGKDQVRRFVMSIKDQLSNDACDELLEWSMGLRRVKVVGQTGNQVVHLDDLRGGSGGVPKDERQGVFVHSFKCFNCGVHFMTFSWQADRHKVGSVMCPECGDRERLGHWRVLVNVREDVGEGGAEIYNLCPYPGSGEPLPDSWDGDLE
jgi:DNA-directed RNA polymerase subunit RPC12/RpoP